MSDLYVAPVSASARQDFYKARQQAALEKILARLTGKTLVCLEGRKEGGRRRN